MRGPGRAERLGHDAASFKEGCAQALSRRGAATRPPVTSTSSSWLTNLTQRGHRGRRRRRGDPHLRRRERRPDPHRHRQPRRRDSERRQPGLRSRRSWAQPRGAVTDARSTSTPASTTTSCASSTSTWRSTRPRSPAAGSVPIGSIRSRLLGRDRRRQRAADDRGARRREADQRAARRPRRRARRARRRSAGLGGRRVGGSGARWRGGAGTAPPTSQRRSRRPPERDQRLRKPALAAAAPIGKPLPGLRPGTGARPAPSHRLPTMTASRGTDASGERGSSSARRAGRTC